MEKPYCKRNPKKYIMESIYQKIEEVLWHKPVVYETAYGTYLTLFYLLFHLLYQVGSACGIFDQDIGIAGNFEAITAIDIVPGEN